MRNSTYAAGNAPRIWFWRSLISPSVTELGMGCHGSQSSIAGLERSRIAAGM
ncbi:MAG: hypothetical protein GXY83_14245 [Rhodopirellula sp.]|nr:hypothetical protein [Rhodopirellula sp.]